MPQFLSDSDWRDLIDGLVEAAHDPADPASAVAEILACIVCPEGAREDIERHT